LIERPLEIIIHYHIRLPCGDKVNKRGWRRSLRRQLKRLLKGIKNSLNPFRTKG